MYRVAREGRTQKVQSKGFFFNSSYRRTNVLHALFRNLRDGKDDCGEEERPEQVPGVKPLVPERNEARPSGRRGRADRAAG